MSSRTLEQYLIDLHPHLAEPKHKKLLAALVELQRWNRSLPKDVEKPKTRVYDWKDNMKYEERLKNARTAIRVSEKRK